MFQVAHISINGKKICIKNSTRAIGRFTVFFPRQSSNPDWLCPPYRGQPFPNVPRAQQELRYILLSSTKRHICRTILRSPPKTLRGSNLLTLVMSAIVQGFGRRPAHVCNTRDACRPAFESHQGTKPR